MKRLLEITSILSVLFFVPASFAVSQETNCQQDLSGYQVLKKSDILNNAGIKAYIAHINRSDVVVPNTCSKLNGPFFLVSKTGTIGLYGDTTSKKKKLPWGCGSDDLGASLKPKGVTVLDHVPPFLFQGNLASISVSWEPAHELNQQRKCATQGPDYKDRFLLYSVNGVAGSISLEAYSRKDFNGCPRDSYVYKINHVQNEKCENWVTSTLDCDGKADSENLQFKKVLGLLEFKSKEITEKWLIFDTPGYEGDGITTFPFSPSRIRTQDAEFLVYSGC